MFLLGFTFCCDQLVTFHRIAVGAAFAYLLKKLSKRDIHKKIRPFIIPIVVTLVVLVLFHSIFMLGYVPTESMEQRLRPEALYWVLGSSMSWRPAISLFLDVTAPIS